MESPFEYNKYVSGSQFIGRSKEVGILCNLIRERSSVLMYAPAKTGKKSIIYNAMEKLRQESYDFTLCNLSLFNIRCVEAFMLRYATEIFSCFSNSASEWNTLQKKYIPSAPYSIDKSSGSRLKFTYNSKEPLKDAQILELLRLPEAFARDYGTHVIVFWEQFQDILLFDEPHRIFKLMESVLPLQNDTSYIITGERFNAMREIFEEKKYLQSFAHNIPIRPIDERIFTEFIVKGFLKAGKVVQPDLASQIYNLVGGDAWYTQHLASICFNMTKGYLNPETVKQATACLINLHDYEYHSVAYGLSRHQLRFIKAVLEGVTKFSSADILDKYKLNSSANVNRLKEALTKKEIITFDEKKNAVFLDPLFKLWFIRYFFI